MSFIRNDYPIKHEIKEGNSETPLTVSEMEPLSLCTILLYGVHIELPDTLSRHVGIEPHGAFCSCYCEPRAE